MKYLLPVLELNDAGKPCQAAIDDNSDYSDGVLYCPFLPGPGGECVCLGNPGCPAVLIIPPAKCQWNYDRDCDRWQTECRHYHNYLFYGPKENKADYCQYCGREIEVA